LALGATIGVRSFDRSVITGLGLSSPQREGELSSALELSYQLREHVRGSMQARLGGSFSDNEWVGGGTTERSTQSWSARGGFDWFPSTQGPAAFYLGLAYEYGEARAFINDPGRGFEEPRSYFSGASLRTGVVAAVTSRARFRSEVLVGGAYANTALAYLDTRWLSTSATAMLGVDVDILSGRAD